MLTCQHSLENWLTGKAQNYQRKQWRRLSAGDHCRRCLFGSRVSGTRNAFILPSSSLCLPAEQYSTNSKDNTAYKGIDHGDLKEEENIVCYI